MTTVLRFVVWWHRLWRHSTGLFYCHREPCGTVIRRVYGAGYGKDY